MPYHPHLGSMPIKACQATKPLVNWRKELPPPPTHLTGHRESPHPTLHHRSPVQQAANGHGELKFYLGDRLHRKVILGKWHSPCLLTNTMHTASQGERPLTSSVALRRHSASSRSIRNSYLLDPLAPASRAIKTIMNKCRGRARHWILTRASNSTCFFCHRFWPTSNCNLYQSYFTNPSGVRKFPTNGTNKS